MKAANELEVLLLSRIEAAENAVDDKALADAVADIYKISDAYEKLENGKILGDEKTAKAENDEKRLALDQEKFEHQRKVDESTTTLEREKFEHLRKVDESSMTLEREKFHKEVEETDRRYKLDCETLTWEKEKTKAELDNQLAIRQKELENEFRVAVIENGAKVAVAGIGLVAIAGILDMEKTGTVTSKALSAAMNLWSRKV